MTRDEAESLARRHYLAKHGDANPMLSFGWSNEWVLDAIMEAGSRVVVERRVRDRRHPNRTNEILYLNATDQQVYRRAVSGKSASKSGRVWVNERGGERRKAKS